MHGRKNTSTKLWRTVRWCYLPSERKVQAFNHRWLRNGKEDSQVLLSLSSRRHSGRDGALLFATIIMLTLLRLLSRKCQDKSRETATVLLTEDSIGIDAVQSLERSLPLLPISSIVRGLALACLDWL
jgi:hypothetical protein